MKFELPQDMVLVSEPSNDAVPNHYFTPLEKVKTLSVLEDQFLPVNDNFQDIETNFKSMKIAMNNYNDTILESRFKQAQKYVQQIHQQIEYNENIASRTSQLIDQEFKINATLQNKEVQEIVHAELERVRKEKEEQRRKEEAEKRAREEAEKRKKEEEEKRKKEEEERQRAEQEKIKKEEEAKRVEELKKKTEAEERSRKEAEEKKQKLAQLTKSKAQSALYITDFEKIASEFDNYKRDIANIKSDVVAPVAADPVLKKNISALRRKINPKFGQLSNSLAQWRKINSEIIELINLASSQELAKKWILNFVAKAIVDQAETEVIVRPGAALPLAYLACSLLQQFPDFEYYLVARLVKKCPFIIGYSRPIDTEEGRLKMGWKRKDNKWEDEVKYDERISGICTVWATMTRLTDFGDQRPFFSFEASWKFLARLLNTDIKILSNAHFSLASNWWEVTAPFFLQKYGNQSKKLMYALSVTWTAAVSDKKFPAAARLMIMGEDWIQRNKFETPPQMTQ